MLCYPLILLSVGFMSSYVNVNEFSVSIVKKKKTRLHARVFSINYLFLRQFMKEKKDNLLRAYLVPVSIFLLDMGVSKRVITHTV